MKYPANTSFRKKEQRKLKEKLFMIEIAQEVYTDRNFILQGEEFGG